MQSANRQRGKTVRWRPSKTNGATGCLGGAPLSPSSLEAETSLAYICILGQPRLRSETLSQKLKENTGTTAVGHT